jgi:hypothetical protein
MKVAGVSVQVSGPIAQLPDTSYEITRVKQRTAEPQNIEYRMSKGGIASLRLFKIDRIHYSMFDVGSSMLTARRRRIRCSLVSLSIKLAAVQASGDAYMKLRQKVFVRSSKSRLKTAPTIYISAMHQW